MALKVRDPVERRRKSLKYIEMVGLGGMENRFPSQLPGGEQQRVAVARALAMEPLLLLADEPRGNPDAETGHDIWNLLRELNITTGTTIVSVTHWAETAGISHRTVYLRSGRVERVELREKRGAEKRGVGLA
ncbi:MAG: ATP-binding cassette domain-containing protein [Thermoplasmata archaeon]